MADNTGKQIEYVRLGKSGLKVSKLIMGCMSFGSPAWGEWVMDGDEGTKHIKAAYDAGINAFDTADVYSNGESERILGKAIREYKLPREEIVVLTKLWGAVSTKDVSEKLSWATGVGVTAPIVGTSSIENLRELIAATDITLTDEEKKYLEEAYQTQPVFGHV
ncbi:NADP-dependent oxidoreductase domain-containing protein [Mucidula mucida]|nr:NADP-dependent oxidoreductase domain-containing protein [Mucidula mucida]